MVAYDLLMLAILVGLTLYGYFKGMAWQVAYVASFVASYLLAVKFADRMAPQVTQYLNVGPPANKFVAMGIIYIGASLAIWMLFRVVRKMIDSVKMEGFDHQMGAILGFGRGLLWCIGITFVLMTIDLTPQQFKHQIVSSKSGYYIAQVIDKTDALFPPEVHEVIGPYLARLENELEGSQPPAGFQQQAAPAGWPSSQSQPAQPAPQQPAAPSWEQSAPAAPSGWPQAGGSASQQPAAPSASDFGWPAATNSAPSNAPPATPAQQVTWPQWDR